MHIADDMPDVDPSWPVLEDPASYAYIRPEGGGLLIGLFEGDAACWSPSSPLPSSFSFGELDPNWDRLVPFLDKAMSRVPISKEVGMKKLFCG
ncbi:MAG: FAD-dependent oxidoreductase, partial [Bacteroidota bacterium]